MFLNKLLTWLDIANVPSITKFPNFLWNYKFPGAVAALRHSYVDVIKIF